MSAGDAVVVRVLIVEDRQKLAKLLQMACARRAWRQT